jgi:hypothetical protein
VGSLAVVLCLPEDKLAAEVVGVFEATGQGVHFLSELFITSKLGERPVNPDLGASRLVLQFAEDKIKEMLASVIHWREAANCLRMRLDFLPERSPRAAETTVV